jgi:TRAP-type C4-dicarboxylate transport system permease small subunit
MPAEWPVWLARMILTVGIFFLSLRLLIQFGQRIRNLFRKAEEPSERPEETGTL